MSPILVTGANGFLASHVVLQLLEAGHKVKGTVRDAKAVGVRAAIGDKYPNLELVPVNDVASADLTNAMKDVSAVIHVAVPLPFGGANAEENLSNVVEGVVNVLRQAVKNGISKVVLTSSWSATIDPTFKQAFEGLVTTEKDWGNVTKGEFVTSEHDPSWYYLASKVLSERAAWDFAKREPKLDLSVIVPPFIFGPYASGFPLPNVAMLGSNAHIYGLLNGNVPLPLPPLMVDVRDVAKAHILALQVPPANPESLEDKRFLVCGGILPWKDMVERLRVLRPELASRLPAPKAAYAALPGPITTINSSRAEKVLGLKDYIKVETTFLDTVESLLKAEKA